LSAVPEIAATWQATEFRICAFIDQDAANIAPNFSEHELSSERIPDNNVSGALFKWLVEKQLYYACNVHANTQESIRLVVNLEKCWPNRNVW
jgi:hypothetical protein